MKKATQSASGAKPESSQSASAQIDAKLRELGDWRGRALTRVRAMIRQADPQVIEEVKWRGVPVWSHAGHICTGEVYKSHVKLTFPKGASLEDPSGLFNATLDGKVWRAIDIHEGEDLDEKAFKALVRAAIAHNTSRGPKSKPAAGKTKSSAAESKAAGSKSKASAAKPKTAASKNDTGNGKSRSASTKAKRSTSAKGKPPSTKAGPRLLSGENPQIAKGEGDAPIQAYIAAVPGWKQAVCRRFDALVTRTVPGVRKAVKWNSPFYGIEGQGWFLSFHCFTKYVKVGFFRGSALDPLPPGASKTKDMRYLDIHEDDELDEKLVASWVRQASKLPGWLA
jgi:hypothetical protein